MKYVWGIILLFVCNSLFAQHEYLLHKNFADRYAAIDSTIHLNAKQATDSSIKQQYNELIAFATNKGDNNLELHLKLEQAYYLLQKNKSDQQQFDQLQLLTQQSKTAKDKYLYPYALFLQSDHLSEQDANTAFRLQLKAYDIYKEYSIGEYPAKRKALYNLASSYYRFRDHRNVIKYLDEILNDPTFLRYDHSLVNMKALSYQLLQQYDSALHYFKQMKQQAGDSVKVWALISNLNIGHTYYLMGNEDDAERIFKETYQTAKANNTDYAICESATILGKIALKRGDLTQAKTYLNEAISSVNHEPYWYYKRMLNAKKVYDAFTKIYAKEQNYKMAYLYSDSVRMVTDSINRKYDAKQAAKTEQQLLLSKYEQEQENLRLERKQQKQMRDTIIVGIILLSIISILFINRQRIRRKQLLAEKTTAETKLLSSKKQLADYTRNLQEKNQLIEQFKTEIEQYKSSADEEAKQKTLQKLQESTILTDEDWVKFRNMFEEVHLGFLHKLKHQLPDLTPGEVRFMVLSKLKLSTKEMANILGVGASTIRKYKHQVRNKLGLPEDGSIDEVIDLL